MAWLVGFVLLASRPMIGVFVVARLRYVGRRATSKRVRQIVDGLCWRMGIKRSVEVCEAGLLDVPAVLGELKGDARRLSYHRFWREVHDALSVKQRATYERLRGRVELSDE